MDAYAYARQLKSLLPRGVLWALEQSSTLSKLLLGIADELVRVDGRGVDLLDEWDPRTADETLEDWERVLDLDPAATTAARRLAATGALIAQGGATEAYFIAVALALGCSATIAVTGTFEWTMTIDISESSAAVVVDEYEFRTGAARSGDYLRSWTYSSLEDVINKLKPAHTKALFVYVA